MAKAIKRVGVIFLAVAIICLMAIGVILGINGAKCETTSSLNLNNEIENVSETRVATTPIVEEVLLDGTTCEEQAEKWTEAINKSLANGGNQHILVTMTEDWFAPNSGSHVFGTDANAFSLGRIYIPNNTIITLDINGHTLSRQLTSGIPSGSVFFVTGNLTLKDSKYDSAKLINAYKNNSDSDLLAIANANGFGKITGGYSAGDGGVMYASASIVNINGVVICENYAMHGGAFCTSYATLTINDGLIANNRAENWGGALYITRGSITNFNNGFIYNNKALKNGGGLYLGHNGYDSTFNFSGGIFAKNSSQDDGGAMLVSLNGILKMSGGLIEGNIASGSINVFPCGGGICFLNTAKGYITGGVIRKNISDAHAGGVYIQQASLVEMSNCIITENVNNGVAGDSLVGGGVVILNSTTQIGAGLQVYDNLDRGNVNNFQFYSENLLLVIKESLINETSITHIGITLANEQTGTFTSGYKTYNSSIPSTFFFSDANGKAVTLSSNEAALITGTKPTTQVTWKYGTQQTTASSVILPYREEGYDITSNLNYVKVNGENRYTSVHIKNAGNYSYYVDGNYLNPTFMVTIEEPVAKIEKPTIKDYAYVYNGNMFKFYPENFDANTMDIAYYMQKDVGKYTAQVSLKNSWQFTWSDGTTDSIEYQFEIIHPGVVLKDNSNFDYIYKDSNNLRQSYKANKIIHKVSESETTSNYVIGNIAPKTTIKQFVGDIRKECGYIKIYNGNTLLYDGTTETEASDSIYVATGYRIELYKNSNGTELLDTVYLSVLGDVVANGVIDTADVTFISRIVNGEIKLETLSIEQQLAAMVDNKGKVTSTDGKILLNVIGGNTEVDNYFENVAQKEDYQILVLNSTSGKTYRQNMNLTTLNVYDNAIIGNIAPNTKASEFKTKLASQTSANISDITIHKANGAIAGDNDYIGTGYYISYAGKTIYLSVLGDLTGDGIVNTMDVTYLNRIISGNVKLNTNDIKDKLIMLSAIIQNKGNLTTADSETLLNYIGGNADITKYF